MAVLVWLMKDSPENCSCGGAADGALIRLVAQLLISRIHRSSTTMKLACCVTLSHEYLPSSPKAEPRNHYPHHSNEEFSPQVFSQISHTASLEHPASRLPPSSSFVSCPILEARNRCTATKDVAAVLPDRAFVMAGSLHWSMFLQLVISG